MASEDYDPDKNKVELALDGDGLTEGQKAVVTVRQHRKKPDDENRAVCRRQLVRKII